MKTPQGGCFHATEFTETPRLGLHREANSELENLGIFKIWEFFCETSTPQLRCYLTGHLTFLSVLIALVLGLF